MFQLASAQEIAISNGAVLCLAPSSFAFLLPSVFKGPFPPKCTSTGKLVTEQGFARYTPFLLSEDTHVKNYLQSYRYFQHAEDLFSFREDLRLAALKYLRALRVDNSTVLVGVHVRHTDLVSGKPGLDYIQFPPDSYFQGAMAEMTKRFAPAHVQFVVVSDDAEWCSKQTFFGAPNVHVESHSPELDLAILANCDGVVITVGTFGWWGAFLSRGLVLYYHEEFKMDHRTNKDHVVKTDYYLPTWSGWTKQGPWASQAPMVSQPKDHVVKTDPTGWDQALPSDMTAADWCPRDRKAFLEKLYRETAEKRPASCAKKLVVGVGDGSKELCEDLLPSKTDPGGCIVYSLGSRLDFTFEADMRKAFGCDVFTFDCTVGEPAPGKVPAGVEFHPWCVGRTDELKSFHSDVASNTNNKGQYYTLSTIMRKLNHDVVDVLKMDIERYEFEVVEGLSKLAAPTQILMETHVHNSYGQFGRPVSEAEWNGMWGRLDSLGYGVIGARPNPKCLCCCEYSVRLLPVVCAISVCVS
jgi:hypothetical protein